MVEKLMRSWCRVNIFKRMPLKQVAEETSNEALMELLRRYEGTSELVCAAFAVDLKRVKALLWRGTRYDRLVIPPDPQIAAHTCTDRPAHGQHVAGNACKFTGTSNTSDDDDNPYRFPNTKSKKATFAEGKNSSKNYPTLFTSDNSKVLMLRHHKLSYRVIA